MIENCKTLWDINGIGTIMIAIKLSSSKHDLLGYVVDLSQSNPFIKVFNL